MIIEHRPCPRCQVPNTARFSDGVAVCFNCQASWNPLDPEGTLVPPRRGPQAQGAQAQDQARAGPASKPGAGAVPLQRAGAGAPGGVPGCRAGRVLQRGPGAADAARGAGSRLIPRETPPYARASGFGLRASGFGGLAGSAAGPAHRLLHRPPGVDADHRPPVLGRAVDVAEQVHPLRRPLGRAGDGGRRWVPRRAAPAPPPGPGRLRPGPGHADPHAGDPAPLQAHHGGDADHGVVRGLLGRLR